ncbi:MAG: hypothetical protein H7A41_03600 [Chlamydiales bacterium]|nr:hypothetical protein [Chlamydiales bacterium]
MAEFVQQTAARMTPEVQKFMFEGLQGMRPKPVQQGWVSWAVSNVKNCSPATWVCLAGAFSLGVLSCLLVSSILSRMKNEDKKE